jgi:hypothetical protein
MVKRIIKRYLAKGSVDRMGNMALIAGRCIDIAVNCKLEKKRFSDMQAGQMYPTLPEFLLV